MRPIYALWVLFFCTGTCTLGPKDVFIIIHGTWSIDDFWHQTDGEFFQALELAIAPAGAKIVPFNWPGKLSHASRILAGTKLAYMIESYPPEVNVNIIGHSHGANVAIIASNALRKPPHKQQRIKNLYLLGAPVHAQTYMPNMQTIDFCYNLFSLGDTIQPVFGLYERTFPHHERIANIRVTINALPPSHADLHSKIIGTWIAHIAEGLQKTSWNGTPFTSDKPALINFKSNASPEYCIDLARQQDLDTDKIVQQQLSMLYAYSLQYD